MNNHVCCEIQYDGIHSDLCSNNLHDSEWREVVHSALDEWLDKSNGDGCFYIGNVLEMVSDLLDRKKMISEFGTDVRMLLSSIDYACQSNDDERVRDCVQKIIQKSEKFLKLGVV